MNKLSIIRQQIRFASTLGKEKGSSYSTRQLTTIKQIDEHTLHHFFQQIALVLAETDWFYNLAFNFTVRGSPWAILFFFTSYRYSLPLEHFIELRHCFLCPFLSRVIKPWKKVNGNYRVFVCEHTKFRRSVQILLGYLASNLEVIA